MLRRRVPCAWAAGWCQCRGRGAAVVIQGPFFLSRQGPSPSPRRSWRRWSRRCRPTRAPTARCASLMDASTLKTPRQRRFRDLCADPRAAPGAPPPLACFSRCRSSKARACATRPPTHALSPPRTRHAPGADRTVAVHGLSRLARGQVRAFPGHGSRRVPSGVRRCVLGDAQPSVTCAIDGAPRRTARALKRDRPVPQARRDRHAIGCPWSH